MQSQLDVEMVGQVKVLNRVLDQWGAQLGGRAGGSSHGPWRKGWSGGADWPGEKIRLAKGIFILFVSLIFTFLFHKLILLSKQKGSGQRD